MKTNTINKSEINKFNKLAEEWWNPEGSFKPLHKFNPIRIRYIKDNIIKHFNIKSNDENLSDEKKFQFDVWYNPENNLILKVTFSNMGKWEYRIKNFE